MNPGDPHIDNIFRDGIDSGTPGVWDSPSELVWNDISARLREERRRRRLFFWWLLGAGAIAAVILSWMLAQPTSEAHTPVPLIADRMTMEADGHFIPSDHSAVKAAEEVDATTDAQGDIPGKIMSATGVMTLHQGTHDQNQPEREVSEHDPVSTGYDMKSVPDNFPVRSRMPEDRPLGQHGVVSQVEESHTDHISFQSADPSNPQRTIDRKTGSERPVPTLYSELTPLAWHRSLPVMPFVSPGVRIASISDASSAWELSVYGAPSWGTRHIRVPHEQPRVRRRLLLASETPVVQAGFGAEISRSIGAHWSFSTGLEYSSFLLEGTHMHQVRYTRAGERLNGRGNLENTLALNLNTSFGTVATDVVIERSSASQIDEHRFIGLELQTAHTMRMLQIPLSLGYQTPLNSKWNISLKAGATLSMILKNDLAFRVVRSLDQQISDVRVVRDVSPAGAREMLIGYHAGLGLHRSLDDQWSLFAEPVVSGSFQSLYQSESIAVYPVLFDIHLGVQYHF